MPTSVTRSDMPPRGFTLIELAVVVAVVALLTTGLAITLSAQLELQHASETRTTLDQTREALLGFAAANGRLPCPASSISNGQESFCTTFSGGCTATLVVQSHGRCSNAFNGFLPGATLGVTPADPQGYVLDGWGNRIRYAVADNAVVAGTATFTGQNGIHNAGMSAIETAAESGAGLLFICSESNANVVAGTNCGTAVTITRKTPALAFSVGKNRSLTGAGADEQANVDNKVFVSHEPTAAGGGGEYDDHMTWLSLSVLFNRMISAGQLP